jgi:hypothetical protein
MVRPCELAILRAHEIDHSIFVLTRPSKPSRGNRCAARERSLRVGANQHYDRHYQFKLHQGSLHWNNFGRGQTEHQHIKHDNAEHYETEHQLIEQLGHRLHGQQQLRFGQQHL